MENDMQERHLFSRLSRIRNSSNVTMIWEAIKCKVNMVLETTETPARREIYRCYSEYDFGDHNPDTHITIFVYPQGREDVKIIMPGDLLRHAYIDLNFKHGQVRVGYGDEKFIKRTRIFVKGREMCSNAIKKAGEMAEEIKSKFRSQ